MAQHQWEPVFQERLQLSIARLDIHRIHTGGLYLNQQIHRAHHGDGNVHHLHQVIAPVTVDKCGLHPRASKSTYARKGCKGRIGCSQSTAGKPRTNTTAPAGSRGSWATRSTTTGTPPRSTWPAPGCPFPS